jgi:dephospho-CoA kinase
MADGRLALAIVVGGGLASGKTSVAKGIGTALACPVVSFGGFIRRRARSLGLSEDRATLQALGAHLVDSDPVGFTSSFIAELREVQDGSAVVIEGLRHVSVCQALRDAAFADRLLVVMVKTSYDVRMRRSVSRGDGTAEEFALAESRAIESEHLQLEAVADLVLDGDRPIEIVVRDLALTIGIE